MKIFVWLMSRFFVYFQVIGYIWLKLKMSSLTLEAVNAWLKLETGMTKPPYQFDSLKLNKLSEIMLKCGSKRGKRSNDAKEIQRMTATSIMFCVSNCKIIEHLHPDAECRNNATAGAQPMPQPSKIMHAKKRELSTKSLPMILLLLTFGLLGNLRSIQKQ